MGIDVSLRRQAYGEQPLLEGLNLNGGSAFPAVACERLDIALFASILILESF
jgi:hypothetical protein